VRHERPEPGSEPPFLAGFRHLSVILQIFDGAIDPTRAYYERQGLIRTEEERRRFDSRARCVWSWIDGYAPEDFRYRIRAEAVVRTAEGERLELLRRLVAAIEANPGADDAALGEALKSLVTGIELPLKDFYPLVYDLLIDRDRGPKLSTLLAAMGSERALPLLRPTAKG
jgi:lysyl-tRNA synthetase class 1